ncbi:Bug family tripartite tricarboxylate transporter substrate binding protein [Pigmentiphaga humi]|nr:tripartite tricarboxylate transporter substrate binding protein [Pigmentiphaga humi]
MSNEYVKHPRHMKMAYQPSRTSASPRTSTTRRLLLTLAATVACGTAMAQSYPNRPIRLVIPFPPGGGTDVMARMVAQKLQGAIGQAVVVENKAGGDTIIAAQHVARAQPDGYTLLMAHFSTMALNPALYPKLPYDPIKDFAPISQLTYTSIGIIARADAPYKSVRELVDYAKANPGKLSYGSSLLVTKLFAESFKAAAGIDVLEVPYRGSGQILTALLAGDVNLSVADLSQYVPHVQQGTLRVLATSGATRFPQLPQTPTIGESGFKDTELSTWFGLFAPAGTPPAIIQRLNAEVVKILKDPQTVKEMQDNLGYDATPTTPEQLEALVKADMKRWGPEVRKYATPAQ